MSECECVCECVCVCECECVRECKWNVSASFFHLRIEGLA